MKLPSATEATRSSLRNAAPKPFVPPAALVKAIEEAISQGKFAATYDGPGLLQVQAELQRLGYTALIIPSGMNEQSLQITWNSQDRY